MSHHPIAPALPSVLLPNSLLESPKTVLLTCQVAGCNFSSSVKKKYNQHVSLVHNKKPAATTVLLKVHNIRKTGNAIPCSETGCAMAFASESKLRAHVRKIHKIENRPILKCDDCPLEFHVRAYLVDHQATIHGKDSGRYKKCDTEGCEVKNVNVLKLAIHKAADHNIGVDKLPSSYRCDVVGCTFWAKSTVTVKRHKVKIHGVSLKSYAATSLDASSRRCRKSS